MRQERYGKLIELRKFEIKKDAAVNASDNVKSLLKISERALNNSRTARKGIRQLSSRILQYEPFIKSKNLFITVTIINFKTKQRSRRPKQLLLPVNIEFHDSEGNKMTLNTVLDFENFNLSLQSIQKEIVRIVIGDFTHLERRTRRSTGTDEYSEPENIMSIRNFHKLCSSFKNSMSGLHEVALSLNKLATAQLANNTVNQTAVTIQRLFPSLDIQLNRTLAKNLGINVTNIHNGTNHTASSLIDKVIELLNVSLQSSADQRKLEVKLVFSRWHDKMESITNQTHEDCSGLSDCLAYSVHVISMLFDDVYANKTHPVFGVLKALDEKLDTLMNNFNNSVENMLKDSNDTLSLLERLWKEDVFCLQAPNITNHPPAMIELVAGRGLLLFCNATGDELSYSWQLNGTDINNLTSNTLEIKSVTRHEQGSYACVVSNRVSRETSSPTLLIVHDSPDIIKQPVRYLAPNVGDYAYLECKGEAKGVTYQWIYQSTNSTNFTKLRNKTFPVLSFPTIRSDHKGIYICVVSTLYGKTNSTPTVMEPLRYSMPVPSMTVTFAVESIETDLYNLN